MCDLMRYYAKLRSVRNTLLQSTLKWANDYPVERGPRATERLKERQKHSRTPIQSSRFLSYRFHRPLEISG